MLNTTSIKDVMCALIHADSLQDDLSSEAAFSNVHDAIPGRPSFDDVSILFTVVTACLKRHSVRPKSSEVSLLPLLNKAPSFCAAIS